MKTVRLFVFASIVALVGVGALAAAGTQEGDFLPRLETALNQSDLSEEEVQEIMSSAEELSWDEARQADPQLVAEAITNANAQNEELSAEDQAEFGLEIARNAQALQEEGYERSEVSRSVLKAVQTMQGQIEDWKSGDKSENLGEIVRSTVRSEARKAAEGEKAQDKSGSKAQDAQDKAEDEASY